MKLLLKLLLLLLFVTGCKTKHVQIEQKEDKRQENKETKKDSVFEQKTENKSSVFQLNNSQSFELDLETEKDSTGQSKTLEFERIRSPNGEKIIVRGGKVKLKSVGKTYMSSVKKDTLQVNSTSVRTAENTQKNTEIKSFNKQKEVKTQGFTFGFYLWIIIILLLLFLAWRLKFFGLAGTVIAKFKRHLKNI